MLPAGVRFKFPDAVPTVNALVFLTWAVLTLPAVTLPAAVIDPLVKIFPLACTVPATLVPTGENTATLPTPLTLTVMLALAEAMSTLLVPLLILATLVITPVNNAPLPKI